MRVPWTTPVRSGSSSPSPDICKACCAAANAYWAKMSVPSSIFSSIQSSAEKSGIVPHQAVCPGVADCQGAGLMPLAPAMS